jgi:hypothetical protein
MNKPKKDPLDVGKLASELTTREIQEILHERLQELLALLALPGSPQPGRSRRDAARRSGLRRTVAEPGPRHPGPESPGGTRRKEDQS